MVNKKGQEGWTLINLLIALLVLVVIGAGIYYIYTYASTTAAKYEISGLQNTAIACEVSAKIGDLGKPDYCTQPKPLNYGSGTRYVNCNFDGVKNYITDETLKNACTDADLVTMCSTLSLTLGTNYKPGEIYVNDRLCKDIAPKTCAELGGTWVPTTAGCGTKTDVTYQLAGSAEDIANPDKMCCK